MPVSSRGRAEWIVLSKAASPWVAGGEVDGLLGLRAERLLGPLHPLPPFEVPILEHLLARLVQRPVVALPIPTVPGDLDETLVEREVVPYGVLPAFLVLCVVRELVHYELVDAAQRQAFVGALCNGHCYQGNVGIGRLDVLVPVGVYVDLSE